MNAALIAIAVWLLLGLYLAWPSIQNFRTAALAGRGARHRSPGLPSVRRGRALAGARVAGA